MNQVSVHKEMRELKSQLSYAKNIGFFMGAGTSCALGLPNVSQLTTQVENNLHGLLKATYQSIKSDLFRPEKIISIEDILNQVRLIREITEERSDREYNGVSGENAVILDTEICKNIYNIITEKENSAQFNITKKFFAWLNSQNRDFSKEIFTTNYDLIIEKSLESIRAPYFDGFVGSYEPFFWQDSVETFIKPTDLTKNWIRLWKIHGSLSWFWKKEGEKTHKVIRLGKVEKIEEEKNEIVIYPSKEKYNLSRRQPFLVYFDRLKNYLSRGELLFIFSGYSFMDQHINEIIFNALRKNNRLTILVFCFLDSEIDNLYKLSTGYLNISAFGPTKAIINGGLSIWKNEIDDLRPSDSTDSYWNDTDKKFLLGDFNHLVEFLVGNSGRRTEIEAYFNDK